MKSSAIVKPSTDRENKTKASSEAAGSNGSSGGKKKLGFISSLYNNSATNQITMEKDLYDKFKNNIAITPNDIMKLNKYTESIE